MFEISEQNNETKNLAKARWKSFFAKFVLGKD